MYYAIYCRVPQDAINYANAGGFTVRGVVADGDMRNSVWLYVETSAPDWDRWRAANPDPPVCVPEAPAAWASPDLRFPGAPEPVRRDGRLEVALARCADCVYPNSDYCLKHGCAVTCP